MEGTSWVVAVAAVAAFAHSVTTGANLIANCWGPALGAKAVSMRTALILGVICQCLGNILFGPEEYTVYGGFIDSWHKLAPYPGLTVYSLMWIVVTPVIWQALAIWQKTLVPAYLGAVASTAGAILVFPGASTLEFGHTSSSPPYITGLISAFLVWVCAPILCGCVVGMSFLHSRDWLFRRDDPLHQVLWVLPTTACVVCVVCGLVLMYGVGSPHGTTAFKTTPQGACIILSVLGSVACIAMSLAMPYMSRRLRTRVPIPIKRINLLGLDNVTLEELAAEDVSRDVKGWLQRADAWLFEMDLFESVPASTTLMRIHSTAEEYEAVAEEFMAPFQIVLGVFLSLSYGANTAHTSFGVLAIMRYIHTTGCLTATANLGIKLRCVSAIGTAIGALFFGRRLAPITGVWLAKMTPFRSYIVTLTVACNVGILGAVQLRGGVITYIVVSAVTAVGLVEGTSHINWRVLNKILLWWIVGFCLVMLTTSLLVAQGIYAPSLLSSGQESKCGAPP